MINGIACVGCYAEDQERDTFAHIPKWLGVADTVCIYGRLRYGEDWYLELLRKAIADNPSQTIIGGMETSWVQGENDWIHFADLYKKERWQKISQAITKIMKVTKQRQVFLVQEEGEDAITGRQEGPARFYEDGIPPNWKDLVAAMKLVAKTGCQSIWDLPVIDYAKIPDLLAQRYVKAMNKTLKENGTQVPKWACGYLAKDAHFGSDREGAYRLHAAITGRRNIYNRLFISRTPWAGELGITPTEAKQFITRWNQRVFLYVNQSSWATAAEGMK